MAATVPSALLREALQPQPQREERFVFLQQRGGGPGQRGGLRLMDGEQQFLPAGEVPVEGALADAGRLGDRGEAGGGVVAEGRAGGLDEACAVLPRVGARRTPWAGRGHGPAPLALPGLRPAILLHLLVG